MKEAYVFGSAENKKWQRELCEELFAFGHKFPSEGGSSYYLGDDGTPWTDRPRETWITSRMTHVYSIGTLMGHEGAKELAEAGLKGLKGELKDKENGGWYPGIRPDGSYLADKQCYAHAFVILASSSAYLAGVDGAKELLDDALALYDRFFWDEKEGLAVDIWNTEFTKLDPYRGLNANMHTVEAFLAVADAVGDQKYRVRAGRIIDHVVQWASENGWRIPEHFTEEWVPDLECNKDRPDDPFKPYGATPGHGIEWSRLITQWTVSVFDKKLIEAGSHDRDYYLDAAQKLFDQAVEDAWNADGAPGICYTTDWTGKPVVHDRMHWTLAEALNTSAVLYTVTGKEGYRDRYAEFAEYLDETVHDKVNGSWFHQLDQDNKLMNTVWPGKSDIYHALQSTLIPFLDPGVSVCTAVKEENK